MESYGMLPNTEGAKLHTTCHPPKIMVAIFSALVKKRLKTKFFFAFCLKDEIHAPKLCHENADKWLKKNFYAFFNQWAKRGNYDFRQIMSRDN